MAEAIPPSDLIGQHPTQLQQEAANKFIVATLLGVAAGVTTYYASQSTLNHYNYPLNNGFRSQINSSGITPDSSYVGGTPRIAPDGSYVGGTPRIAPDGSYVGGAPRMAPDGSYVGGTPRMAPDGSYVGGKP